MDTIRSQFNYTFSPDDVFLFVTMTAEFKEAGKGQFDFLSVAVKRRMKLDLEKE